MASIRKLPDGRWQAQYRAVPKGRRYTRTTHRKVDAQRWLNAELAKLETGTWSDPKTARMSVNEWLDLWLDGYGTRRPSTVRQAKVHLNHIRAAFGERRLDSIRPSHVKSWTAKLQADGYSTSTIYSLHGRLAQVLSDAVHDGIIPRSPCSRRTSPPQGKQTPYVATTEQVWALHDALPQRLRAAVLLGAFAGLRISETCGLRIGDIDFMRGIIRPAVQFPDKPLKSDYSKTPIPIPESLALRLSAHVASREARRGVESLLVDPYGRQLSPWGLERALRAVRPSLDLPDGFHYHDLRHYFASLLIADGADVKVVQTRMRHGDASTTLRVYTHLWPDSDTSTKATIDRVLGSRGERVANEGLS